MVSAIQAGIRTGIPLDSFITDATRSRAVQAKYYKDKLAYEKAHPGKTYAVAAPGTSNHQFGTAIDMAAGPMRSFIRDNAGQFGLQTIPNDTPHIQLAGASAMRKSGQLAELGNRPPGSVYSPGVTSKPTQTASLGPIATSSANPNSTIAAQIAAAAIARPQPPIPQQKPAQATPRIGPAYKGVSPAELQQAINGNLAPAENNRAPTDISPPMVAGGAVPGFQTSVRGRPEFSAMGGMPAAPQAPSSAGMPAWGGSYSRPEFSGMGGFPAAAPSTVSNAATKTNQGTGLMSANAAVQPSLNYPQSDFAGTFPSDPRLGYQPRPMQALPTRTLKQNQDQVPQQTSGIARAIDVADASNMVGASPFADPVPTKGDLDRVEKYGPSPTIGKPSTVSSSISSAPASTVYGGIATPQQMLQGAPKTIKGFGIDAPHPAAGNQIADAQTDMGKAFIDHPDMTPQQRQQLDRLARYNAERIKSNTRRGKRPDNSPKDDQRRRLVRAMLAQSGRTTSSPVDPFAGLSPGQILYQTV